MSIEQPETKLDLTGYYPNYELKGAKPIWLSPYKVMKSAAGYYVGRDCYDPNGGLDWLEPYDRYSGYYATHQEASNLVDVINLVELDHELGGIENALR